MRLIKKSSTSRIAIEHGEAGLPDTATRCKGEAVLSCLIELETSPVIAILPPKFIPPEVSTLIGRLWQPPNKISSKVSSNQGRIINQVRRLPVGHRTRRLRKSTRLTRTRHSGRTSTYWCNSVSLAAHNRPAIVSNRNLPNTQQLAEPYFRISFTLALGTHLRQRAVPAHVGTFCLCLFC